MFAFLAGLKAFDIILLVTTFLPLIIQAIAKGYHLIFGSPSWAKNPGSAPTDDEEGSGSGWMKKLGIIGSIIGAIFFTKGWLAKFPGWLKLLFAEGGALFFLRKFVLRAIYIFRHPIIMVVGLLVSSIFPSILEYFFMLMGYVGIKVFMFFFNIGKRLFLDSEGGNAAMDELRNQILTSVDGIPPCMLQVLGYLHVVENLGIFITTFTLMIMYAVFRMVYGGFFVKAGDPLL